MEPRDFHRAISRLWPIYTPEAAAIDAKILHDIPDKELLAAIVKFREQDESGFPPAPGKLRELCGRSKRQNAIDAWNAVRSLKPCHASNDVARYTPEGKALEEAWKSLYDDPRLRAALKALDSYGGLRGLTSGDFDRARKAFIFAYQETEQRLELVGGQKELPA